MTAQTHAAVWLDHHEARIFHLEPDGFDEKTLHTPSHHIHRHPKGVGQPRQHPDDQKRFFTSVANALASADAILVLGPSTAKTQLLMYLDDYAPAIARRIVGVETTDHPTDPQIVAHVKRCFERRIPA